VFVIRGSTVLDAVGVPPKEYPGVLLRMSSKETGLSKWTGSQKLLYYEIIHLLLGQKFRNI
jgi:hypothetical protein